MVTSHVDPGPGQARRQYGSGQELQESGRDSRVSGPRDEPSASRKCRAVSRSPAIAFCPATPPDSARFFAQLRLIIIRDRESRGPTSVLPVFLTSFRSKLHISLRLASSYSFLAGVKRCVSVPPRQEAPCRTCPAPRSFSHLAAVLARKAQSRSERIGSRLNETILRPGERIGIEWKGGNGRKKTRVIVERREA
ncbi:hypothetical protein KM043_009875 [Ampulex compressa]|nr:hypothetical protein KM043_009875 [Ampulex compressa]